jgi:hypothetical protein
MIGVSVRRFLPVIDSHTGRAHGRRGREMIDAAAPALVPGKTAAASIEDADHAAALSLFTRDRKYILQKVN